MNKVLNVGMAVFAVSVEAGHSLLYIHDIIQSYIKNTNRFTYSIDMFVKVRV